MSKKIENQKKPLCYISGAISSIGEEAAFLLFEQAEIQVRKRGYEPVNPMKLNHNHGKTWIEFMEVDLDAMDSCMAIYLLPNYKQSNGARIEVCHAKGLCLDFINADLLIPTSSPTFK